MLAKWNGKLIAVSFLLNLTALGLPHTKKGRLWNMAKSTWICKFHLTCFIQQETRGTWKGSTWRLVELFKSENDSRHQHSGGSTFGDNLTTSHQVGYMPPVLIPAEATEIDQEHITSSSNKVGSITPLK